MTNDEAEDLLRQLGEHYGEPVMPVGRYCAALQMWAYAVRDRAERAKRELFPGLYSESVEERATAADAYRGAHHARALQSDAVRDMIRHEDTADTVDRVFLMVRKSNLLHRLIYQGQAIRTVPCPTHKGTWSGCTWAAGAERCACVDGCNVTGWLPRQ